jgi:alginate O-acetyltransferase complex protein AlgI
LAFTFRKTFGARPSASITEFWRRWHMTLSRWLRDYIYIPLGGNRRGMPRTYLNLMMLTMLLGGLWHGASWNFVIWGGYHGVLLSIERMIWGRREQTGIVRIPLTALTFVLACIGWVFFRAKTFAAARFVLAQMFTGAAGTSLLSAWQWRLAAIALVIALAEEYGHLLTRIGETPAWTRAACVVAVLLMIELCSATDQNIPFVYFQF